MVALLKRHIIAVPFHTMSDAVASGNVSSVPPLVALNYRMGESMYIKPEGDRLTVIFSISFKDGDDITLSKVFLKVTLLFVWSTLLNCNSRNLRMHERPSATLLLCCSRWPPLRWSFEELQVLLRVLFRASSVLVRNSFNSSVEVTDVLQQKKM